jgi:hypothetical protein
MNRFVLGFLALTAGFTLLQRGVPGATDSSSIRNAPAQLVEAWLRFHESDLCQGIDAVFSFSRNGMEVWSLVHDEKSYQKFQEIMEPLRTVYSLELYTSRPAEKKADTDPPASLWENYELRSFLGDPYARAKENPAFDETYPFNPTTFDEILKQRLLIYAEQIVDSNKKIEDYACEIPALTGEAMDASLPQELRQRAKTVCLAHTQNMGRCLAKLESNLTQALPKSAKRERAPQSDKSFTPAKSPADSAIQIALAGRTLSRRVFHFIYPEHYTVGLQELRESSLLDSIKTLQKMISDYQKMLGKSARS